MLHRNSFTLATVVTLCLLVAACSLDKSESEYIADAERLLAEGDARTADIQLKNVLQQNPDNVTARLLRGTVSLRLRDPAQAAVEFRRARDLGAQPGDFMSGLGEALLLTGKHKELLAEVDPAKLGGDARLRAIVYRGTAHASLRQFDAARRDFEAVVGEELTEVDARFGLARLAALDGDEAGARAHLQRVLVADANMVPAIQLLAALDYQAGRLADARRLYERAAGVLAGQKGVRQARLINGAALVQVMLAQGDGASAQALAESMLADNPEQVLAKYVRALVAYHSKDYKVAEEYLLAVNEVAPNFGTTAMMLGAVNYAQGQLEQAHMYLSSFLARQPESQSARKLLAATRLKLRRPDDAMEALRPLAEQSGEDSALLAMMGTAALQSGSAEKGVAYLEQAVRQDPDRVEHRLNLAIAYLSSGAPEKGVALLEALPESEVGEYRRQLLLAMGLLRSGKKIEAIDSVQAYVAKNPDKVSLNLAGGVHVAAGYEQLARKYFLQALEKDAGYRPVLVNLASLANRAGDRKQAIGYLERANQAEAGTRLMLELARLEHAERNYGKSLAWIDRALEAEPGSANAWLAKVQYHLLHGETGAARAAVDAARARLPESAPVRNAAGLVGLAEGAPERALADFERAIAAEPASALFRINKARAQIARRDLPGAAGTLGAVLQSDPQNYQAGLMLARVELADNRAGAAKTRVQALKKAWPQRAGAWEVEGDIAIAEKRYSAAVAAYTRAVDLQPASTLVLKQFEARRIARLAKPQEVLEKWLVKRPYDTRVRSVLARYVHAEGDALGAKTHYNRILETNPDDVVALNNLAWILYEERDPQATELARRAYRQASNDAAIMDTLGWLLVRGDGLQEGTELLRKAHELAPDNADIQYHYAFALSRTGDTGRAKSLLEALMASRQPFAESASARALLQSLR